MTSRLRKKLPHLLSVSEVGLRTNNILTKTRQLISQRTTAITFKIAARALLTKFISLRQIKSDRAFIVGVLWAALVGLVQHLLLKLNCFGARTCSLIRCCRCGKTALTIASINLKIIWARSLSTLTVPAKLNIVVLAEYLEAPFGVSCTLLTRLEPTDVRICTLEVICAQLVWLVVFRALRLVGPHSLGLTEQT